MRAFLCSHQFALTHQEWIKADWCGAMFGAPPPAKLASYPPDLVIGQARCFSAAVYRFF
jgi:hypothetical protein